MQGGVILYLLEFIRFIITFLLFFAIVFFPIVPIIFLCKYFKKKSDYYKEKTKFYKNQSNDSRQE